MTETKLQKFRNNLADYVETAKGYDQMSKRDAVIAALTVLTTDSAAHQDYMSVISHKDDDMLKEAIRLLEEWDERETQLAVLYCDSEPPVEEGSFVERLRKLIREYKEKNP